MRLHGILLAAALLSASPSPGQGASGRSGDAPRARAAKSPDVSSLPDDNEGQRRFSGEPISLDVKDADLRDVLHTFALLTKLNIAVDPEVRGSVTLVLHDVPWDQALDLILKMNGCGYTIEGNLLRAAPVAKLTAEP